MGGPPANTERSLIQQRAMAILRIKTKGEIQTAVNTDIIHPMAKAGMEEVEMVLATDIGKHLQKVTGRNLHHQIEIGNLHRLSDTGRDQHPLKDTERNPHHWKDTEEGNRLRKSDTGRTRLCQTDSETLLQKDIGQNRLLMRGKQSNIAKLLDFADFFGSKYSNTGTSQILPLLKDQHDEEGVQRAR